MAHPSSEWRFLLRYLVIVAVAVSPLPVEKGGGLFSPPPSTRRHFAFTNLLFFENLNLFP